MRKHRVLPLICRLVAVILFLGLASCVTAPKPLTGIIPGRTVETLSSAVSISVTKGEQGSGGRGYLVFRTPDRFHLVLLSPFGITLLEVFSDGDRLTCLLPGKGVAYSGRIEELPDRDGIRSWGLMRWVVDLPPALGPARFREQVSSSGIREKIYYDERGLVTRKVNDLGDEVQYYDYSVVNGVPLPEVIEIVSATGETVRITLSEPEVNQPLEDSMLRANLEGVKVLPFSAFKGFGG